MNAPDLEQVLSKVESTYPVAVGLTREIHEISPFALGSQLNVLIERQGEKFWNRAEFLGGLARAINDNPAQAVVEFTMETLRAQANFMETKEYAQQTFESAFDEIYGNKEVMEGFYYIGLLLSHAYWPIHFDIHTFFTEDFVPRIKDGTKGTEIAFGHGAYLMRVLQAHPATTAEGFDVSPYSKPFATKVLNAAGIDSSRYELDFADIRNPLDRPDASYDWGIFGEILEHLPDPLSALHELHRILKPGAPLFITTCVDSNAIDHLYQYEDVEAIRSMIREGGFSIASEKELRVTDYAPQSKDPTIDVALTVIRD